DIAWIIFWGYWLASAFGVKEGRASRRRIPLNGVTALSVVVLVRVFRGGSLAVHSPVLGAIGAVVFASGIALAISSRVQLGRNWGMPMTQKAEPELGLCVQPIDDAGVPRKPIPRPEGRATFAHGVSP